MNDIVPAAESSTDLSPRNYAELRDFAEMLAQSGLVPKDYANKPDACMVAMQWGHELGLKPLQSLQNIAIIGNRPSVWGDAMLALVQSSPVCKDVVESFEGDGEDMTAVCVAQRHGRQDKTARFSFSDARTAGLIGKDVWQKYPPRMLQMRARSFALRDQFSDVLRGLPVAELLREAVDMGVVDEVKTPTAPQVPPQAASGESRTDSVKQRMRKNAPPRESAPSLDDVLRHIGNASTANELTAAGELATKLRTDSEKEIARTAYSDKLNAARSSAHGTRGGDDEPPAVTFAAVMDALEKSGSLESLDAAADLIRSVTSDGQRGELEEFYVAKRGKLDAG